jgi:hypothetical protein
VFFSAPESPKGIVFWVGQRPEWRSPENPARVRWNVHNVPTILKLMEVSGQSHRVSGMEQRLIAASTC